jgi:ubiquinone/menaquinone biosynthesis C-methylase UbiE
MKKGGSGKNPQQWNEVFKKEGRFFVEPQEDMPRIVRLFKRHGVEKVLDLGCGSGRHTVYLARHGFSVYGLDVSPEGVRLAKEWLRKEGLSAKFKFGSIYEKLPYRTNFFDAVISTQTLHHARIEDIRKTIKEMERVLKPGGFIFVTLQRIVLKWHAKVKFVAPRTYVPSAGNEKGLPHYMFGKKSIKKEFGHFKIPKIWFNADKRHCCFVGQLKSTEEN